MTSFTYCNVTCLECSYMNFVIEKASENVNVLQPIELLSISLRMFSMKQKLKNKTFCIPNMPSL
jgi:hypothetical protein